jgi:hypothetical protein
LALKPTAIFTAEVEGRLELYLCSKIATFCFIVVKLPGPGANSNDIFSADLKEE